MNTLTDPGFIRCKYTSYLILTGLFFLTLVILLQTGAIPQPSSSLPAPQTAAVLSSGVTR